MEGQAVRQIDAAQKDNARKAQARDYRGQGGGEVSGKRMSRLAEQKALCRRRCKRSSYTKSASGG